MPEGRVLVVDDEADVRRAIRLTLTKAGFDVVEAEDGQK
jgi:two-component system chemotaxis response regulator CheY